MRRVRRLILALGLLLGVTAIPRGPLAFGQEAGIGGYLLAATSAPVAVVFDSPSVGISAKPTMEMSIARTTAKAESGPTSYGLASLVWPGDVAANAPPLATQEMKTQFRENGFPPEYVAMIPDAPPYPVRAETFHPQGPEADRSGIEGVSMSAEARETKSQAAASLQYSTLPNIVSAGSIRSTSRAVVENGIALTESTSIVRDLDIADGLITAEQVISTARVTSDGAKATVGGTFKVVGLRFGNDATGGVHELRVDGNEIHAFGQKVPLGMQGVVDQIFGEQLEANGIDMTVAAPQQSKAGAMGERSVDGLLVSFRSGALEPYVSQLPDQIEGPIRERFALDQVLTIAIGSVRASGTAVPAFDPGTFPTPDPTLEPIVGPPVVNPPTFVPPIDGAVPPAVAPPPAMGGTGPVTVNGTPVASVAVPAALGVFLVMLALFGSVGMGVLADRATASRPAVGCPLEGS